MESRPLEIGISTCPNDTFAFDALLRGVVRAEGLRLNFRLLDIDELNRELQAGRLDVGKASFYAAMQLADRYVVLPCGAALGFGVGPLLLAARADSTPVAPRIVAPRAAARYLCPGELTTAHLLLRLFHGDDLQQTRASVGQVVFSEIVPALRAGDADFGVCIHEGRFTWQDQGVYCVEDLGQRWETATGLPLPLGGILARRDLPAEVLGAVTRAIGQSIRQARREPAATLPTMRQYAQEQDDSVIWQHVELYVNDWTEDLGPTGMRALDALHQQAVQKGLIGARGSPLEVHSCSE